MRRLALWILATIALVRFLRWRRAQALVSGSPPAPVLEPATDPRAEELRAKLDAREVEEEPEPAPEPTPAPDERRRSVHERGRRAAEQMRETSSGE